MLCCKNITFWGNFEKKMTIILAVYAAILTLTGSVPKNLLPDPKRHKYHSLVSLAGKGYQPVLKICFSVPFPKWLICEIPQPKFIALFSKTFLILQFLSTIDHFSLIIAIRAQLVNIFFEFIWWIYDNELKA